VHIVKVLRCNKLVAGFENIHFSYYKVLGFRNCSLSIYETKISFSFEKEVSEISPR